MLSMPVSLDTRCPTRKAHSSRRHKSMEPGDVFPNDSRMDDTTISSRLAAARAKSGVSQEALARVVGVTSKSIYRYESGEQSPSRAVRAKLAEALGVTEQWIEYGADAPEPERIVYDSEADPLVIERVIADLGLDAAQADQMRHARWSKGTSEATLRSYGIDLMRESRETSPEPTKVAVPSNLRRMAIPKR